jgi:hypothetical protein
MEPKTIYAQDLMKKWKMNKQDFIAYVAQHAPCVYGPLDDEERKRWDFLQPYHITRARVFDPTDAAEMVEHLDDVFFRPDNVDAFEKLHPELLKHKKNGPAEKERALLAFSEKHPTLTIPAIVQRFIRSQPDFMYDRNNRIRPGYKQETLEKTLRRLRKS